MAKATPITEQLVPIDAGDVFGPNSFSSILAEYNITADAMVAPPPPTIITLGFDELCEFDSPIYDERGNRFEDINGHTGPLMYLELAAERDSDKFEKYDGYYQYGVLSPSRGKCLVSVSRPAGEQLPSIVKFLRTLQPGNLFQVASFKTSSGFRVFNPVPVQK